MFVRPSIFLLIVFGLFSVVAYLLPEKQTEIDEVSAPEQLENPIPLIEVAPEPLTYDEREVECLALNSYFEARNQSVAGQIAVAQVVLNRVKSAKYPNTICEVIQQGPTYENWKGNVVPVRNQCHFSWWCDGKSDIPTDTITYSNILSLIKELLENPGIDITEESVYYHADYVKPHWINTVHKTLVIDDHVFYKETNQ